MRRDENEPVDVRQLRQTHRVELIVVAVVTATIGFISGQAASDQPHPVLVCHSPTEDSTPTDCDYTGGAWVPRGR